MSWHKESKTEERIGYRFDLGRGEAWYVQTLPEKQPGGNYSDFGYTDKLEKALPLSPYWQRRFRKELERCGRTPRFMQVPDAKSEDGSSN